MLNAAQWAEYKETMNLSQGKEKDVLPGNFSLIWHDAFVMKKK
jgi:hypothetical protein